MSASSDGWRQDEAELGPILMIAIAKLEVQVHLVQGGALVDGGAQVLHKRNCWAVAFVNPDRKPIQYLKNRPLPLIVFNCSESRFYAMQAEAF